MATDDWTRVNTSYRCNGYKPPITSHKEFELRNTVKSLRQRLELALWQIYKSGDFISKDSDAGLTLVAYRPLRACLAAGEMASRLRVVGDMAVSDAVQRRKNNSHKPQRDMSSITVCLSDDYGKCPDRGGLWGPNEDVCTWHMELVVFKHFFLQTKCHRAP